MSKKSLKILIVPQELAGHVRATLCLAQVLRQRGHRICYAIDSSHRELVANNNTNNNTTDGQHNHGFDTEIIDNRLIDGHYRLNGYESELSGGLEVTKPKTIWWFTRNLLLTTRQLTLLKIFATLVYSWFNKDIKLHRIIQRQRPDLILMDDLHTFPSIVYSGIPWVWQVSGNPLSVYDDTDIPTPFLGLSNSTPPTLKSTIFGLLYRSYLIVLTLLYKLGYLLRGYPANPDNRYIPLSPYLNLCYYPEELDYPIANNSSDGQQKNIRKLIYRIDTMWSPKYDQSSDGKTSIIGEPLKQFIDESRGKKLILVSMGSYCSGDRQFMDKLIGILAKTEHRYIVAKGYNGDSYQLPANNMYGQPFLPQRQLLPHVDLLVTNAGNNSLCEALVYGRPLLALPLYLDQFDNGQRLQEMGYGLQLDAHNYTDGELRDALDILLSDSQLKERLNRISRRLIESDRLEIAVKMIENLVIS